MRCPDASSLWCADDGDSSMTRHLASCAACRAEAARVAQYRSLLGHLPPVDVPAAAVQQQAQALALNTDAREFTCAEVRQLLDAWRDGTLDAAESFLLEDHLLWCEPCTQVVAQDEQITMLLRTLPMFEAPEIITEHIAHARLPWWQRWLLPQPSARFGWGKLLPAAGAFAAVAILFAVLIAPPKPKVVVGTVLPPIEVTTPRQQQTTASNGDTDRVVAPSTPVMSDHVATTPPATAAKRTRTVTPRTHRTIAAKPVVEEQSPWRAPEPKAMAFLDAYRTGMPLNPSLDKPRVVNRWPKLPARVEEYHPLNDSVNEARLPLPTTEEPEVVVSAEDSLLQMARDERLARSEEALTDLPTTAFANLPRTTVAMATRSDTAMVADISADTASELRRALQAVKTNTAPRAHAVVDLRNTAPKRDNGVLTELRF